MRTEDIFRLIVTVLCEFPEAFFSIVFAFVQSFLRMFTISMLILSIGKVLDMFGRKWAKAIKWTIYIWFIFYSFWSIQLIANLEEGLTLLDYTTIVFGVVAPICLFVVGRIITQKKIKGHRIFNYWSWWFVYTIIAVVWWLFLPEKVFIDFVFIYIFISMFIVAVIELILRGRFGYG